MIELQIRIPPSLVHSVVFLFSARSHSKFKPRKSICVTPDVFHLVVLSMNLWNSEGSLCGLERQAHRHSADGPHFRAVTG